MQTFMIYTEPVVVTGGRPGSVTTFLYIDLVKIALGQVDLGSAAAMSPDPRERYLERRNDGNGSQDRRPSRILPQSGA